MSAQSAVASATDQATSRAALVKLLFFALTLAVLPVSSYFVSLRCLWAGNHTHAAITAVCIANLVLAAYIVASLLEDRNRDAHGKTPPEPKKLR